MTRLNVRYSRSNALHREPSQKVKKMVSSKTPLLSEAVETYIDKITDELAERSVVSKRNALRRFVRYVPVKQVGRLTTDDLDGYLRALYRGDKKVGAFKASNETTVRTERANLSAFIGWCARKGWLKASVMDDVFFPKQGVRRDFLFLSAREMLDCLESAEPRDRILLATAMNTALRAASIQSLTWGAFDLEADRFYVVISKTRQSDNFPINLDYRDEIIRWQNYVEAECGPVQPGWFLVCARHRPDISKRTETTYAGLNPTVHITDPQKYAKKALRSLGYRDEQIVGEGMHTFRRSLARLYFDAACEKGYDSALRETAALLHHKRTATTELYLGLKAETEARDRRFIGKRFLTGLADTGTVVPLRKATGE